MGKFIDTVKKRIVISTEIDKAKEFVGKAYLNYNDEVLFDNYLNKAQCHIDKARSTYHGLNN